MTKTNWQDPKTGEIISPHISGLQEAVGKLEESIGIETVAEIDIPLLEVFISNDDRCRIYQALDGKRNWILSPTPSIKKNGVIITNDFEIDYGGGAVIFTTPILESDVLTADATYTKKIEGKQLSTNDYSNEEKLKNQDNKDDILNLSATVGDTTIDDTLIPNSDTGLSVKILLSWLANMIKSITGKASWRIKPTKNLEELNDEVNEHKAEKATDTILGHIIAGVGTSIDIDGILTAGGYKMGNFTRDISLADSSQIISGLGFKPRMILFFATNGSVTGMASWGFSNGVTNLCSQAMGSALSGGFDVTGFCLRLQKDLSNRVQATCVLNEDGFTLNWTKTGSPTGTSNTIYIALK